MEQMCWDQMLSSSWLQLVIPVDRQANSAANVQKRVVLTYNVWSWRICSHVIGCFISRPGTFRRKLKQNSLVQLGSWTTSVLFRECPNSLQCWHKYCGISYLDLESNDSFYSMCSATQHTIVFCHLKMPEDVIITTVINIKPLHTVD